MSIFQNILSDYKYLESIKISHDLLINQASNDEWSFSTIEFHPNGDGICEYSAKLDHRHRGLKKLYILKNTQTSQSIAVGAGCYKKIMGKTTKTKLPTIHQWENAEKSLKDFDEKYSILEQRLQKFISDELPSLEHYAKEYKISFDKAAFLEEIKNPEMMGYAVARINSLKHDIREYEKLKKITENKNYILKIVKSKREDEITNTDTEKKKIEYEEKMKKLKQKREAAYQKAREKTAKQLRKPKKKKKRKKQKKKKEKKKKANKK
ncbi:hypothetical protein QR692_10275 [Lactococcus petauri]|uniref:hypothetical protein n=1 Tax=Lactococcus petauri TaxID=1940789 RepID=UPI002078C0FB|nr:hypothetical protein [Lactococcus petauri]USI65369.1 hypothetical protein LMK05_11160 [Lactococcus petauri]USI67864.1 hypothetical protein LMK04_10395 [Lactococcus petauri]WJE12525.1 hypothetical protein QR692_10275 [Lactococcus petauri]